MNGVRLNAIESANSLLGQNGLTSIKNIKPHLANSMIPRLTNDNSNNFWPSNGGITNFYEVGGNMRFNMDNSPGVLGNGDKFRIDGTSKFGGSGPNATVYDGIHTVTGSGTTWIATSTPWITGMVFNYDEIVLTYGDGSDGYEGALFRVFPKIEYWSGVMIISNPGAPNNIVLFQEGSYGPAATLLPLVLQGLNVPNLLGSTFSGKWVRIEAGNANANTLIAYRG